MGVDRPSVKSGSRFLWFLCLVRDDDLTVSSIHNDFEIVKAERAVKLGIDFLSAAKGEEH